MYTNRFHILMDFCLMLLVALMGPGVMVNLPRAQSVGSEEEVRHSECHVVGSELAQRVRPSERNRAARTDRQLANLRACDVRQSQSRMSVSQTLRALQIQIEV